MKCSVFIATSFDGFIAKKDGDIGWLHSSGRQDIDLGKDSDMGFNSYISSVDCIIMGRKTLETRSHMNLSDEQWPYGNIMVIGLSHTIKDAPGNLKNRGKVYSGEIKELLHKLEEDGIRHIYIDGGTTVRSFIKEKLVDEITVTRVPVLLGEGIPLFDLSCKDIILEDVNTKIFPNDYFQVNYKVKY